MPKPQRRPNKAITQEQQKTALMTALVMREKIPDEATTESMARSFGLHIDLVRAMVAQEDLRRRMRG